VTLARPTLRPSPLPITRGDIYFILAAFAASRIALETIGLLAFHLVRPHLSFPHVWNYSDLPWLSIWGVWDSGWYLEIAEHGYDLSRRTAGPVANQANWAFFPAYPALCRGLFELFGLPVFTVMVAVSNACFLAALFVVRRVAEGAFGAAAARLTVALLCFMPGSYVFSSAYPESLFLLLLAATISFVDQRRWIAAGLAAALAAVTRNVGIALLAYIAVSWLCLSLSAGPGAGSILDRVTDRPEIWRVVVALLLPLAALLAFCLYLFFHVGDALAFVSIQDAWLRRIGFPLWPLLFPWEDTGLARNPLNYLAVLSAIGLLVCLAWWRRWPLFALAALQVFVPLAAGLESYLRYTICMLPLVMAGGALLARHRDSALLIVPFLALLNGLMMVGWTLGFAFSW
jgi:hypothetical protein